MKKKNKTSGIALVSLYVLTLFTGRNQGKVGLPYRDKRRLRCQGMINKRIPLPILRKKGSDLVHIRMYKLLIGI